MQKNVPVVPIFDLQEVTDQTVGGETFAEVIHSYFSPLSIEIHEEII
jgi:hypothetical protein